MRLAGNDDAVKRYALAGFDDDLAPYGHFIRIDLHELAIAHDVSIVRGDVHHGRDRFARLADSVAFEQRPHLVEQHDGRAFGHVRLGFREEDERERADGGDGHEQVLVERLLVRDAVPGLREHVVARYEVGDEERDEFDPLAIGQRLEHPGDLEDFHYEENPERNKYAVAQFFLLLVHN